MKKLSEIGKGSGLERGQGVRKNLGLSRPRERENSCMPS